MITILYLIWSDYVVDSNYDYEADYNCDYVGDYNYDYADDNNNDYVANYDYVDVYTKYKGIYTY